MTMFGIGIAAWLTASVGVGALIAMATPGIERLKRMNQGSKRL